VILGRVVFKTCLTHPSVSEIFFPSWGTTVDFPNWLPKTFCRGQQWL